MPPIPRAQRPRLSRRDGGAGGGSGDRGRAAMGCVRAFHSVDMEKLVAGEELLAEVGQGPGPAFGRGRDLRRRAPEDR